MKDYRLSEIKCGALLDPDRNDRSEIRTLGEIKRHLIGQNILFRDMIELPCKLTATRPDGSILYEIVWRGIVSKLICVRDFDNEPEADAFLLKIKRGESPWEK